MRVGIIGTGEISRFHIREFLSHGCNISAVLDLNKEKAIAVAKDISNPSKMNAKPCFNLEDFFKEGLDIVSICTPPELHAFYLNKCINHGLDVFCEKPLVFDGSFEDYSIAKRIISLANKKNKIITANTQWPSIFDYIDINFKKITKFEMYMEPGTIGINMLKEHLAHLNSVLIRLIPNGKPTDIKFIQKKDNYMEIEFLYSNIKNECKTKFILKHKSDRPRSVEFIINDLKIVRTVGENYSQVLCYSDKKIEIEDPFKTSIKRFIESVKTRNSKRLLISEEEILENAKLQDILIKEYLKT